MVFLELRHVRQFEVLQVLIPNIKKPRDGTTHVTVD